MNKNRIIFCVSAFLVLSLIPAFGMEQQRAPLRALSVAAPDREDREIIYDTQSNNVPVLTFLRNLYAENKIDRRGRVLAGYSITFVVHPDCSQEVLHHITMLAKCNVGRNSVLLCKKG